MKEPVRGSRLSTPGDAAKAAEFTTAAEAFANQLIAKEGEVQGLKEMSLQSTQAAEQAKAAVQQNARLLQQKLSEKLGIKGPPSGASGPSPQDILKDKLKGLFK